MTSTQRRAVLRAGMPLVAGLALGMLPKLPAVAASKVIRGAGATFPAPLYERWVAEFAKARPDVTIEYDAVGSGEGVARLITRPIDFAASDAAMSVEQIAQVSGGVRMIPATAGLVSIIYNIPGLAAPLRLSRPQQPSECHQRGMAGQARSRHPHRLAGPYHADARQ